MHTHTRTHTPTYRYMHTYYHTQIHVHCANSAMLHVYICTSIYY